MTSVASKHCDPTRPTSCTGTESPGDSVGINVCRDPSVLGHEVQLVGLDLEADRRRRRRAGAGTIVGKGQDPDGSSTHGDQSILDRIVERVLSFPLPGGRATRRDRSPRRRARKGERREVCPERSRVIPACDHHPVPARVNEGPAVIPRVGQSAGWRQYDPDAGRPVQSVDVVVDVVEASAAEHDGSIAGRIVDEGRAVDLLWLVTRGPDLNPRVIGHRQRPRIPMAVR